MAAADGPRQPTSPRPALCGDRAPAVRAGHSHVAPGQVASVASRIAVPIVALGGVTRGRDTLDLIDAGATLLAVGTESFRDPLAGARIAVELSALCGQRRATAATGGA